MNPSQREQLRTKLLLLLEAAPAQGLTIETLRIGVQQAGVSGSEEEVGRELDYLTDKALARPIENLIAPEIRRARITAEGRDHLAKLGF